MQDRRWADIMESRGVAVREFSIIGGEPNFVFHADGKVIGVVEAILTRTVRSTLKTEPGCEASDENRRRLVP